MFLVYFLFWIVLNGHISAETVILGAAVCALLTAFTHKVLGYSGGKERRFFRHLGRELGYFAYLVREIVKAALVIMKVVWSPKMECAPRLVYFDSGLKSREGRVILADSITLTAGTITVAVNEERFCIHTLDASLAEGIEASGFERRLSGLEE